VAEKFAAGFAEKFEEGFAQKLAKQPFTPVEAVKAVIIVVITLCVAGVGKHITEAKTDNEDKSAVKAIQ
jgi:hypothetical protein